VATHYETLGVTPAADVATVRAAYLAKARVHHPDRHIDASAATRARAANTMLEVNAAWAVLSDREARRRYDASIAPSRPAYTSASTPRPATASSARPDARPSDASLPYDPDLDDGRVDLFARGMRLIPAAVLLTLLLGIFVFTAFAASDGPTTPVGPLTSGSLTAGACVRAGRVLTTVPCGEPHDAVVETVIGGGRTCPQDTSMYMLDASRVACLRPTP
jgi:DnaJ domain